MKCNQKCDGFCEQGNCVCNLTSNEPEVPCMNIRTTVGLRCKACNDALSAVEFDGELCETCLVVVHQVNRSLYEKVEDNDIIEDEME